METVFLTFIQRYDSLVVGVKRNRRSDCGLAVAALSGIAMDVEVSIQIQMFLDWL